MNRYQRIVLLAGLLIFIGMILYPPYDQIARSSAIGVYTLGFKGFAPFWNPPPTGYLHIYCDISYFRLIAQCVGLWVVVGVVFFILRR